MVKFCCLVFLLTSELCYFGMFKNHFEITDLDYNSNQVIVDLYPFSGGDKINF